mgnify:CR=1 FL=1
MVWKLLRLLWAVWRKKEILRDNIAVSFELSNKGVSVKFGNLKDEIFILPLINGKANIIKGNKVSEEEIFFLTGGFIANEIRVTPDNKGEIEIFLE